MRWESTDCSVRSPIAWTRTIGIAITLVAVMPSRAQNVGPMVAIPGGDFEMGRHVGSGDSDELPIHDVRVSAFDMSVFETTNGQYCSYLNDAYPEELKIVSGVVYGVADDDNDFAYCRLDSDAGSSRIYWAGTEFKVEGEDLPPDDLDNKTNHPMVEVSWYGAAAYANWCSEQDGLHKAYNLDTWECSWTANGYRLPTEAEWEYAASVLTR